MLGNGRTYSGQWVLTVRSPEEQLRSAVADERGWTLIELLVGAAVSLFVAAIALAMLNFAVRAQPLTSERAGQIQQGRALIERVSRELRQGEQVSAATSGAITLITYVDSATCGGASSSTARLCRVSYSCGSGVCDRTETNPDGSGTPSTEQVVSGLRSGPVFSYSPDSADPTYVGLQLSFPAEDGDESVTLSDGVALRNYFRTET